MRAEPAPSRPRRAAVATVGVDCGGTFTDFVALVDGRIRTTKVLSTPDDPSRAILSGLRSLDLLGEPIDLVHGTTVGTNAVLEGRGARTVFVTSPGFADLLTIGRQQRDHLYRLLQPPVDPPVPHGWCLEIDARADPEGRVLARPSRRDLEQLARKVRRLDAEAVAVNLLFGWRAPELEQQIRDALPASLPVSLGCEVLPEIREYERGIATWLNASIGPLLATYLERLQRALPGSRVSVMQSSGLSIDARQAAARAVHLLLSGPAGGLAAAAHLGRGLGFERVLSFDMGGTSTDVALTEARPRLTREGRIGRWPVAVPMVDLHTIGAGGGSIARVDRGGLIQVGPASAGADPGPVCYGNGGREPTVTDANLLLGRLPRGLRLAGRELDVEAARAALGRLGQPIGLSAEQAAEGVVRIANEQMSRALRVMSAERGVAPESAVLMCFGGAGGLHVCALAESLGMTRAMVPARGGVLSALGMLIAEPGRQATASILKPSDRIDPAHLAAMLSALQRDVTDALRAEGVDPDSLQTGRWISCRYAGQSASLELPADRPSRLVEAFHRAHEARFGYRLDLPVELVGVRIEARGRTRIGLLPAPAEEPELPAQSGPWPVTTRRRLGATAMPGPAIVIDTDATCWIAPGWVARCDEHGHLHLRRDGA